MKWDGVARGAVGGEGSERWGGMPSDFDHGDLLDCGEVGSDRRGGRDCWGRWAARGGVAWPRPKITLPMTMGGDMGRW